MFFELHALILYAKSLDKGLIIRVKSFFYYPMLGCAQYIRYGRNGQTDRRIRTVNAVKNYTWNT